MKRIFLIITLSVFVLLQRSEGFAANFDNIPQIAVKGEASIFKPADQMEMLVSVVTENKVADEALAENNGRMQEVISDLKELGLDEADYQTGYVRIEPMRKEHFFDSSVEGEIDRYEVTNTIVVKTKKIGLSNQILTVAAKAGANKINEVAFTISNPQMYREEAIKLAAQNALAEASALASAAGVRIIRILDMSLDHWHRSPGVISLFKSSSSSESSYDPLIPGQTEIHVTVHVVLEIRQQ